MLGRKLALIVVLGSAAFLAVTVLIALAFQPPAFHAIPILRTRGLSNSEVTDLLNRDFKIVRNVSRIPAVVKDSIAVAWGLPFAIADPDGTADPDVPEPRRKLSFVGVSDPDAAFIVYDVSGFAVITEVVVIRFGNDPGLWCASFGDSSPRDLPELREAIAKRRFSTIPCRRPDDEMPKPRGRSR